MFSDYTRYESIIFIDEKQTYAEYAAKELDSQIDLLEESSATMRRYIADSKMEINDILEWNGDVEQYRKCVLSDFSDKIKNYEVLRKKNETLLGTIQSSIDKNLPSVSIDTLITDEEKKHLMNIFITQMKEIKERLECIKSEISSYARDKKIYEKISKQDLLESITNIKYWTQQKIAGYEGSINSNTLQIRSLKKIKALLLTKTLIKP